MTHPLRLHREAWDSVRRRSKIEPNMDFPNLRMRRLRRTAAVRSLVRETHLHPGALIYPLFVCPGEGVRRPINSMPGVFNLSVDEAIKEANEAAGLGLGGLLLFGLPETKDEHASGAWDSAGIVQQALRAMKRERALDSLVLIADVCLCEYMSHGHCGVVRKSVGEGPVSVVPSSENAASGAHEIDNDATIDLLARTAV